MKISNTRERLLASSMICGMAFLGLSAPHAYAAAADAAKGGEVSEIVVTGSRIARQDYVASSPIVTVGQADVARTGAISVDKLLNQLPQFMPAVTDTSNNPSNGG
ncbi:MAG: hypothetical protein ABJB10_14950, partial [Mesorhizobium sp.]